MTPAATIDIGYSGIAAGLAVAIGLVVLLGIHVGRVRRGLDFRWGTFAWHATLLIAAGALGALLVTRTSEPAREAEGGNVVDVAPVTIDALTLSIVLALFLLAVLTRPGLRWLRANIGT